MLFRSGLKIGVLADIHGNMTALEAVLKDAKVRGIEIYILLGDLFTKGPCPQEVYQKIKQLEVLCSIQGNTDRWGIEDATDERQSILGEFVKEKTSQEVIEYISSLPTYQELIIGNHRIHLVHDSTQINIDKKELILSAHTHIPTNKDSSEKFVLNPGSVGIPYDNNPRASYGVLQIIENDIEFQIVRVDYDIKKEKNLAVKMQIPYLKNYISNISMGMKI